MKFAFFKLLLKSFSFFCLDAKETKNQDWNSQRPTCFSEAKKQKLNADLLNRHFSQLAFLHFLQRVGARFKSLGHFCDEFGLVGVG